MDWKTGVEQRLAKLSRLEWERLKEEVLVDQNGPSDWQRIEQLRAECTEDYARCVASGVPEVHHFFVARAFRQCGPPELPNSVRDQISLLHDRKGYAKGENTSMAWIQEAESAEEIDRRIEEAKKGRRLHAELAAACLPCDRSLERELILNHDNPSLVAYERLRCQPDIAFQRELLYNPENRAALAFRAADRSWMLSAAGLLTDLLRALRRRKYVITDCTQELAILRDIAKRNLDRHREEHQLYVELRADDLPQYGFLNNTLYSGSATHAWARRVWRESQEYFGVEFADEP